jgi:hypothetical protein
MTNLFLGEMVKMVKQSLVPPMLTHRPMQEVLMDGSQLRAQYLIDKLNDPFLRFHDTSPLRNNLKRWLLAPNA